MSINIANCINYNIFLDLSNSTAYVDDNLTLYQTTDPHQTNKMLNHSNLKECEKDKINGTQLLKKSNCPLLSSMWEKEKMLGTSIFSFSHNVFKSFLSLGSTNKEVFKTFGLVVSSL